MNMKTNKINTYRNTMLKIALVFAGLLLVNVLFAQTGGGTHPGEDPISVPIDGGILMALLAGGGLITMLFKKKKKDE